MVRIVREQVIGVQGDGPGHIGRTIEPYRTFCARQRPYAKDGHIYALHDVSIISNYTPKHDND
jgi:hypothetical protein